MSKDFCHLHLHTIFSVLDSVLRPTDLAKKLKRMGQTSCAITDHGTLGGVIDFQKALKAEEIKSILGIEIYVTLDDDELASDPERKSERTKDNYHMVLLAMDKEGYENLTWLSSNAYLKNFYNKPRVSWQNLLTKSEGLICTTACLGSIFSPEKARKRLGEKKQLLLLNELKESFGDRLYLEFQPHDMTEQRIYNEWLAIQSKKLNLPTIITTDCHYLNQEDHLLHTMIMAKKMKTDLQGYEEKRTKDYGTGFYVKSGNEMYEAAVALGQPQAYENVLEISSRCNFTIEFGEPEIPFFDITQADDYQEFLNQRG